MLGAGICFAPCLPAFALNPDDDNDDDSADLIPDIPVSSRAARKKPGEVDKKTYSDAEVAYAFADLIAARRGLDTIDRLLSGSDLPSVTPLLAKPPFSSAKANLLTLVQGPGLGPAEKKQARPDLLGAYSHNPWHAQVRRVFESRILQIGTEKRYGLGADVIIMLGGLQEAVDSVDIPKAKSFSSKAKNALDEIIAVCKEGGLKM